MKRAALITAGLSVVVGAVLVAIPEQPRHAASPTHAPIEASQSHSAGLATVAPGPPTPAPVQARRMALRPTPASRSRHTHAPEGLPAILIRIRGCESGHDYQAQNSRSTASGAYQFLDGTWRYVTGLQPPASAYSRAIQDRAALKLYQSEGTRPWNASRSCWS